MVMYTYKCFDCAATMDREHSIKEDPTIDCEVCQGKTRRVIQPTAFQLKNGGWFKDGYSSHRDIKS